MMPQKVLSTVVLSSNNLGKLREISDILTTLHVKVVPQSDFNVPDIAETGLTFVENAIIKARNAAKHTGLPALADDSGLEVDALYGAPGIYSARYAGERSSDEANYQKLLGELAATPEAERTARFRCVLVFMQHALDPSPLICQGVWEGRILSKPQGQGGFGYDPIFFVPAYQSSAAELSPAIKNSISHRAIALAQFMQAWRNLFHC